MYKIFGKQNGHEFSQWLPNKYKMIFKFRQKFFEHISVSFCTIHKPITIENGC